MRATRMPLLLLGLAACGSHDAAPQKKAAAAVPAVPAEDPITEADGLVVLARGAEPRRALHMIGKTGDAGETELVLEAQVDALHSGGAVTSHLPAVYSFLREKIVGIDGDQFWLHFDPRAIRIPARPALAAKIRAKPSDQALDNRAGLLPWPTLNEVEQQLKIAAGGMPVQLEAIQRIRLPETPVGPGARWRTQWKPTLGGATLETQVEVRLTALTDDEVVLEIDVQATHLPVEVQGPKGMRLRVDELHGGGHARRSLQVTGPASVSMNIDSRFTVLIEAGGEVLSNTDHRSRWAYRLSSPPADEPDSVKPDASSLDRARRCTAQIARLRAMLNGWELGSPDTDALDSPVPYGFAAPAGVNPMTRFTGHALGIQLDANGAVTLLRSSPSLHWQQPRANDAFVQHLRAEIDRARAETGAAPIVAIVAEPATDLRPLERIRHELGADVPLGIAVHKSNRTVTDEVVATLPGTPAWARAILADHGGELMSKGLLGGRQLVPDLLRAGALCPAVAPIMGRVAEGEMIDVVFPAVVDAAESCRCEGIDVNAYLALLAPIVSAASHFGFVRLPPDLPLTTTGDLVSRIGRRRRTSR